MKSIIIFLFLGCFITTPILGQHFYEKSHNVKKKRAHEKRSFYGPYDESNSSDHNDKAHHFRKALKILKQAKHSSPDEKIKLLRRARKILLTSNFNKGEHKSKAVKLIQKSIKKLRGKKIASANIMINRAIKQVKLAIKLTKKRKHKPQPHMKKALENLQLASSKRIGTGKILHLKIAKAELKKADSNKGGFRIKAIDTINRALKLSKRGKHKNKKHHHRDKRIEKMNRLIKKAISEVKQGIVVGKR